MKAGIQREEFPEFEGVHLRSISEEGRLVAYQVQVLRADSAELWRVLEKPWSEMKAAYRVSFGGGKVAPVLKFDVRPRYVALNESKSCSSTCTEVPESLDDAGTAASSSQQMRSSKSSAHSDCSHSAKGCGGV